MPRTPSLRQFCTIDPSEARVEVPDPNFRLLCEKHQPKNEVPAFLHVTDIAGLVKGASEGEGLGNAFLSHISACDAIIHICRVFTDTMDGDTAAHVEGEVDPGGHAEPASSTTAHRAIRMPSTCHVLGTRA